MDGNWERARSGEIIDLRYWNTFRECFGIDEYVVRVSLHNKDGLSCYLSQDDQVSMNTCGNSCYSSQDWLCLISEAEEVRQHYFPNHNKGDKWKT